MSDSTTPASTNETGPQRSVQFSLRTLLIAVTIVAAVAGFFRWRWLNSPETIVARRRAEFSQRFAAVPLEVGDWVGEDEGFSELVLQTREAHGAAGRVYRHRVTGAKIGLSVFRGSPDTNSNDIFYGSCDLKLHNQLGLRDYGIGKHVHSIQNAESEYKSGVRVFELQTFSTTGDWERPNDPEWEFRRFDALTNLQMQYVASDPKKWGSWPEFDSFVVDIFPHLQDALFPHSTGSTDPHWIERPIVPRILWLEAMTLFGSLGGLIYLSRRKGRITEVRHEPDSAERVGQEICT